MKTKGDRKTENLLRKVRACMTSITSGLDFDDLRSEVSAFLSRGKMLRARLCISMGQAAGVDDKVLIDTAAAVELLQSASLLHDDVIDGGVMRRGIPALWSSRGTKVAILAGDILVSRAFQLICNATPWRMNEFAGVLSDMCEAEITQDIRMFGQQADWVTCESIARGKTGRLFGFAAATCPEQDAGLHRLLSDAGTILGTAYQLADDILDATGAQEESDKSIGLDGRNSSAAYAVNPPHDIHAYMRELVARSCRILKGHAGISKAWQNFVDADIMPVMNEFTRRLGRKGISRAVSGSPRRKSSRGCS